MVLVQFYLDPLKFHTSPDNSKVRQEFTIVCKTGEKEKTYQKAVMLSSGLWRECLHQAAAKETWRN